MVSFPGLPDGQSDGRGVSTGEVFAHKKVMEAKPAHYSIAFGTKPMPSLGKDNKLIRVAVFKFI